MLSRSAGYALRAVHHLAHRSGDAPLSAGALARALDLPENYLSKLLHRLQQEGVVESRRGPGGGFWLAREAEEVALADVVGPFDDLTEGSRCLLGHPECSSDAPCPVHDEWMEVVGEIRHFFATTSLADLPPPSGDAGATPPIDEDAPSHTHDNEEVPA